MLHSSLGRMLPVPSGVPIVVEVVAASHPIEVRIPEYFRVAAHGEQADLPEQGLIAVATWRTDLPLADCQILNPFAIRITSGGEGVSLIKPNPYWRFLEGGNGELESAGDSRYVVRPSEPGYFECFTSPDFTRASHLIAVLSEIERSVGGNFGPRHGLLRSNADGSANPDLLLVKQLAEALLASQALVTQLQADSADRNERLHRIMAMLTTILFRADTNPLLGMIRDKQPDPLVRTAANQFAAMVAAAREETGVAGLTDHHFLIGTDKWWPVTDYGQFEKYLYGFPSEVT